jgi:hypothetical protein
MVIIAPMAQLPQHEERTVCDKNIARAFTDEKNYYFTNEIPKDAVVMQQLIPRPVHNIQFVKTSAI